MGCVCEICKDEKEIPPLKDNNDIATEQSLEYAEIDKNKKLSKVNDEEVAFARSLLVSMEVVDDCKEPVMQCLVIQRLVAVLNYYNSLMLAAEDRDSDVWKKKFIEFCDEHYGDYWMMEDYMHFIAYHSDLKSTNQIAAALEFKCFGDLKVCGGTSRHYRNRQRDVEEEVHYYIDIMDSLHFNLLHLVDVGLRVNVDWNLESQQSDGLVDQKMFKMKREIQMKRQQTAFSRIDATIKNSKFSLCSTVGTNGGAKGGMTKMDSVLKDFQKDVGDEAAVHHLVEFVKEQRYDTETMNEDTAIYAESKQCNIQKAMKAQGDGERFGAIRRWLRYHRVSGSSFSTGIWWAYWPWYRTQTIESLMSERDVMWNKIDFGGHSMESLCVYPHFGNLKDEALGSGLISAKFWKELFEKATRYLQSSHCKKMVDEGWGYALEFGVPKNFQVTVHHLMSLLLYTDSSIYCTALSETFRAIKCDETIEEMNSRNSMFYWTSRYLRELVHCFGVYAHKESTPFFTGISYEMSIPQFKMGLIGPSSTSVAVEVALRFAGQNGMMLVLEGGGSKCFDASMFSAYPEEQERIFCGSTYRETVTSVVLVNSAKNYSAAIGAYSKFDAIFSSVSGQEGMTAVEMEIIAESLRWIQGDDAAVNHEKLDLFILETFYSIVIHKKMVYLNLLHLWRMTDKQIVNTVMNPLWHRKYDDENSKDRNANLMKPFVFTVFPDVHQIRISAWNFPFDLISFLRMMRKVNVPETLEFIFIDGREWLDDAFTEKVKEEYAANRIGVEKREKNKYERSLCLKF